MKDVKEEKKLEKKVDNTISALRIINLKMSAVGAEPCVEGLQCVEVVF